MKLWDKEFRLFLKDVLSLPDCDKQFKQFVKNDFTLMLKLHRILSNDKRANQ